MTRSDFDINLDALLVENYPRSDTRPYTTLLAGNGDFQDSFWDTNTLHYDCSSANAQAGSFAPNDVSQEVESMGKPSGSSKSPKKKTKKDRQAKNGSEGKAKR